jgi:hypothetical protein
MHKKKREMRQREDMRDEDVTLREKIQRKEVEIKRQRSMRPSQFFPFYFSGRERKKERDLTTTNSKLHTYT